MDVKCPHCGTEYEVEQKDLHRYTQCEVCGKGFVAGAAATPAASGRSGAAENAKTPCATKTTGAWSFGNSQSKGALGGKGIAAGANASAQNPATAGLTRRSAQMQGGVDGSSSLGGNGAGLDSKTAHGRKIVMTAFIVLLLAECGTVAYFCARTNRMRAELLSSIESTETQVLKKVHDEMSAMEEAAGEGKRKVDSLIVKVDALSEMAKDAFASRIDEEKYAGVLKQIDDLSQRIYGLSVALSAEQHQSAELSKRLEGMTSKPQSGDEDKSKAFGSASSSKMPETLPTTQSLQTNESAPRESADDLKRRYKANLVEIDRLRLGNPACVLKPDVGTKDIRNTDARMMTNADLRYCSKSKGKVVYVRNEFYCTNCRKSTSAMHGPCCSVSAKKGFAEWKSYRAAVEETTRIVNKIDELYQENAELKKRIPSM